MASFGGSTDAHGRDSAEDAKAIAEVETAARSGDVGRAVELALAGLKRGIIHPLLLNLRAYWLEGQDRDDEALLDLRRAASLAPNDFLIWNAYGLSLAKHDRRHEAVAAFETSVRLNPEFAPAHYNLGWSLEAVGDLARARANYEKAFALNPQDAAPLAQLAMLAARRADWREAKELADRAIATNSNLYSAHTARIHASIAEEAYDEAEAEIFLVLAKDGVPLLDRSILLSQLGDLRHAQKRYAEAFDAYKKGNEERRKMAAPQFEAPGVESAYSYAVWLRDYFETAPPEKWRIRRSAQPTTPDLPKAHVVLCGFPRSGTTLLENILGNHPEIVALDEKELLTDPVREFFANAQGRQRLAEAEPNSLRPHRETYWRQARQHSGDLSGRIFVDKNPLASMKLPIFAKLFPSTKIIFALRDPRDVVLSCFRRQFQMNPAMFELLTLEGAAQFYDVVMSLSTIYRDLLGLDWHELRNEKLVEDFEGEARKVCDFIGVEWDEKMRSFAERAHLKPIATPSSLQVMRGLNSEGVGQWCNYREQLAPIFPILQPWIEKFGYPAD